MNKDPDAVLDYRFDWAGADPGPWLETGETITASSWIVDAGLTQVSDSHTDTTATVWLSGGTAGVTYRITNRITTSNGRIDDRTERITVVDR